MDKRSFDAERFRRLSAVTQLRLPIVVEKEIDSKTLLALANKMLSWPEQPTHSCYDYVDND